MYTTVCSLKRVIKVIMIIFNKFCLFFEKVRGEGEIKNLCSTKMNVYWLIWPTQSFVALALILLYKQKVLQ